MSNYLYKQKSTQKYSENIHIWWSEIRDNNNSKLIIHYSNKHAALEI